MHAPFSPVVDAANLRAACKPRRQAVECERFRSVHRNELRHHAREWRADHGGLRLPPYKLFGAALEAEGAEVVAKVRQWAEAVEAKQPQVS